MTSKRTLFLLAATAGSCFGASILLPSGSITIPAVNPGGFSFVYTGTLTGADTIAFMQIGGTANNPCLQGGPASSAYCTNGGGIVTVAGTTGVGGTSTFSGTFNGTSGTWNFGSLILEISGEGAVQVFAASVANGLGSATPPTGLTLAPTSLSALGFGSFTTAANPTITFLVADNLYPDNTQQFVLSQIPEPSSIGLLGSALGALVLFGRRALRS